MTSVGHPSRGSCPTKYRQGDEGIHPLLEGRKAQDTGEERTAKATD